MAYNLAVSLHLVFPELPIAVLSDGTFEAAGGREIGCQIITVPSGNAFHLKTRLNEFTPWDNTIYIDADSLVMNEKVAKSLIPDPFPTFQAMEYGRRKKGEKGPIWVDTETAFDHYGLPDDALLPEYNSSILLFTKDAEPLFKETQKAYLNPCKTKELIGGYFPDEVAFSAGTVLSGIYSEREKWQPIFFRWHPGGRREARQNALISLAGGKQPRWLTDMYLARVRDNAKRLGVPNAYPFHYKSKVALA